MPVVPPGAFLWHLRRLCGLRRLILLRAHGILDVACCAGCASWGLSVAFRAAVWTETVHITACARYVRGRLLCRLCLLGPFCGISGGCVD